MIFSFLLYNSFLLRNKRTSFCFQTVLRRTYDEAFSDNDDDDDWVFDPALDRVMVGGGAAAAPLLEFDLQPIGARRNWRNVLNRQRFEASLRQHREIRQLSFSNDLDNSFSF